MYQYITDKQFLKDMKCLCADIINQLVQSINNDDLMTVEAHLVGSGAKNLIMQNANESVDLDYNLCVLAVFGISIDDGRKIKEHIQKHFNLILRKFRLGDCKDSTSVLSTPLVHFKEGNQTEFKIDLAIVCERNKYWERLIHNKTGFVAYDQWYWNQAPNSKGLTDKVRVLKEQDYWLEVRDVYLKKKNIYLCRSDKQKHPSFNVYIETINEVYAKYF